MTHKIVAITIILLLLFFTLQAPEPGLSQFPVTHYSLTCTADEGDSCSETLPASTTSYDLPVVAGVQYTITVSALSNDRESQDNQQLNISMLLYFGHAYLLVFDYTSKYA